jgi:hypothetical protein
MVVVSGWILRMTCMLAIAGCGRVGFDPRGDDTLDDANGSSDGSGAAEMLTFPAVADTALNSFAPLANYGGGTTFNVRSDAVSTYVGLVRFDLAGTTGTVVSATLRISTSTQAFASGTVQVARVLEAWDEGTQTGGSGVANYGVRQGVTMWSSQGCAPPQSREAAPIASLQPTTMNTRYEVVLPPELVASWIDAPTGNYGLALFASGALNDSVAFLSRESAMPPDLVVHVVR